MAHLRAVTTRWPLVAAVLVASTVVTLGLTSLIPPTYQASARIFVSTRTTGVNPNQQLAQGGRFSVERVASYAELAVTPRVLEPVIRQLGLTTSADELASRVSIVVPTDTVLMEIQARDSTPEGTAALANAVAEQLDRVIAGLEAPARGTPSPVATTVLQQATPPADAVWPSVSMGLANGLIAGLLLGVGIAFFREKRDVTVTGPEDLAEVTDLPVLATVGHDTAGTAPPIAGEDPYGDRWEGYRRLRTNLQFAFVDDRPDVVTVTSAVAGEGASSVATNLALSLRQGGSTVCLLDADLRRPSVADHFGLPENVGLTSLLIGRGEIEDVIRTTEDGLHIVASGPIPPNPGELLASDSMTTVLRELARRHDVVVVDTPPSLPVADASVLASRSSGTLFVVHLGRTTRRQVELGLRSLGQVDARVLGIVLNAGAPGQRRGAGRRAMTPPASATTIPNSTHATWLR